MVCEYTGSSRARALANAPKKTGNWISEAAIRKQKKRRKFDHLTVHQCHWETSWPHFSKALEFSSLPENGVLAAMGTSFKALPVLESLPTSPTKISSRFSIMQQWWQAVFDRQECTWVGGIGLRTSCYGVYDRTAGAPKSGYGFLWGKTAV